jgi:hypothetical protein
MLLSRLSNRSGCSSPFLPRAYDKSVFTNFTLLDPNLLIFSTIFVLLCCTIAVSNISYSLFMDEGNDTLIFIEEI